MGVASGSIQSMTSFQKDEDGGQAMHVSPFHDPQQDIYDAAEARQTKGKRGLGFSMGGAEEIGSTVFQSAGDLAEQNVEEAQGSFADQLAAHASLRHGGRAGDWECPSCQARCYASKPSCYKCGTSKPGGHSGGTSHKREREWGDEAHWGAKAQRTETEQPHQVEAVASHYNARKDLHRQLDSQSAVIHLKNFNNWVKSVLINEYCPKNAVVLDFCCGKAVDAMKWSKANVDFVTFVDNAYNSILDGTRRYSGVEAASRTRGPMSFGAQFMVADCFEHDLVPRFQATTPKFDIVSCQFALHYSFQSQDRALQAIRNIATHLRPGGYFVGTIPDANVLVRKLRNAPGSKMEWGNSVTRIRFEGTNKLFCTGPYGIKYNFYLKDAIDDCPEYLIPFNALYKLCAKAGLECVRKDNFHKFFYKYVEKQELRELLGRMNVLTATEQGMSADEWEACFLYTSFVFRKKGESTEEKYPPGYWGREARRVITEEEIECFPGYGPNAGAPMLQSPDPSPRLGPRGAAGGDISPRFNSW